MFLVGLNGSPNKNGNTKYLLEKIMKKANELGAHTEILDICEIMRMQKQPFCTACSNPCMGSCYKNTELEEVYKIIGKADGLILGSPVYFGSVSAQLKAFFDKSRKLRTEKKLYNKVACGVTSGASKYGGQETTMKALHDIMLVQGMLIIGDGFADADCGHHGVCAQRPAEKDDFAAVRSDIIAKRLVEVCEATVSLRKE